MEKLFYTLADLHQWPEVGATLRPAALLAVIGDPIAHSRSPQLHNPALLARGIEGQYIRVHVPPGSVREALDLFSSNGFVGVNCTIPHKFEALAAMDDVDGLASQLGAVNTVLFQGDKRIGYNSDGPGFLRSVQEAFGCSVEGLKVLIIGAAGGAGRAVAMQCALENCSLLVLANRSVAKLQPLAQACTTLAPDLEVQCIAWEDEALVAVLDSVDLIVNATPLGMKEGDPALFPFEALRSRHLVYDMVYRGQGDTPLIAAAKASGAPTCDGLRLLLHQGAISFEHWFGAPAPLEAMRLGLRA